MSFLLVHFKCEDYARFRSVFESKVPLRQAGGSKGAHLFQAASDPNDVWITLTFDDQAAAQALISSEPVREAMREAGVIGAPEVYPIEDAGRTPA
jgi:hypothetical protein